MERNEEKGDKGENGEIGERRERERERAQSALREKRENRETREKREKREGRREKGEGRREKGEGRREKGEGRREKREERRETGEERDSRRNVGRTGKSFPAELPSDSEASEKASSTITANVAAWKSGQLMLDTVHLSDFWALQYTHFPGRELLAAARRWARRTG